MFKISKAKRPMYIRMNRTMMLYVCIVSLYYPLSSFLTMFVLKYTKYILGIFALTVIFWSNTTYYTHQYSHNINSVLYTKENSEDNDLKYILQWKLPNTLPFKYSYMGLGQTTFITRNCSKQNCFVTSDIFYLQDFRDFDAIVFHGPGISKKYLPIPRLRSPRQKYIFVSQESPSYYPICRRKYIKFFNWTWTYKLNSDILYTYLIIRNKQGEVIGPKEEMHWMKVEEMLPVADSIKEKLRTKSHAAAWFVSNCESKSKRERFVDELQVELAQYGLHIDIYGECGSDTCNVTMKNKCWKMIERDYYFYMAFENSFADDYVTEKLLNPLRHYTVPIVFGGANYTRFMPNGTYLNALELGIKILAKEMFDIIKDTERYGSFFKWHHYYSYHDPEEKPDTDPYCRLCAS